MLHRLVGMKVKLVLTVVLSAQVLACGGSGDDAEQADVVPVSAIGAGSTVVADVGFATPESVLHDVLADVYLVSNINGQPVDEDGNGFISRLSPDGEVLALKWIDGEADGVTLNAPKGMAVAGEILFVTDISVVRMFDRQTGEPRGEISIEGADFLNDVASASDGGVYVTDTGIRMGPQGFEPSGNGAVYHIASNGDVHTMATDPELGGVNGVIEVDGEVWVVTFGSGELYRLSADGKVDVIAVDGGLDGIVVAGDEVLISSWGSRSIYRGPVSGPFEAVITDLTSPADIGYDATRNVLLVPLFQTDEVRIVPIG
jgi:hypothetical protein